MNPIPIPILVKAVARVVAIVGVLLAAFLVVPLRHDSTAVAGVTWAGLIALVALVAVFVHQTRRINHSRYPMMAGTESLIIVLALFILSTEPVPCTSQSPSCRQSASETSLRKPTHRAGW